MRLFRATRIIPDKLREFGSSFLNFNSTCAPVNPMLHRNARAQPRSNICRFGWSFQPNCLLSANRCSIIVLCCDFHLGKVGSRNLFTIERGSQIRTALMQPADSASRGDSTLSGFKNKNAPCFRRCRGVSRFENTALAASAF